MSHPNNHVISLAVDATTSDEVIKAFEVLSRVASSLALDGIEVRLNHFIVEQVCEECMEAEDAEEDR